MKKKNKKQWPGCWVKEHKAMKTDEKQAKPSKAKESQRKSKILPPSFCLFFCFLLFLLALLLR